MWLVHESLLEEQETEEHQAIPITFTPIPPSVATNTEIASSIGPLLKAPRPALQTKWRIGLEETKGKGKKTSRSHPAYTTDSGKQERKGH